MFKKLFQKIKKREPAQTRTREREISAEQLAKLERGADDFVERFGPVIKKLADE